MFSVNDISPLTFAATAGILVVSYAYSSLAKGSRGNHPPGPIGLPFFGPRLSSTPWKDFAEWGKNYGDILYIKSYGKGIMVLNSHPAAVDLLDRRGSNYSDRQTFIMNEYLTRGLSFGMVNVGDMWRKMRRASHECLSKTGVTRYYHVQEREALIFTQNLLCDSSKWNQEVARTAASGMLTAVYDLPPRESINDPLVSKFNDFHEILISAVTPGLIEYSPWLQYLPSFLTPWKTKAQHRFLELSSFFGELMQDHGEQESSAFAPFLIREKDKLGLSDTESAWLAATVVAGFGSNNEALLWLFLALIAHPEKQQKCQEELDAIVGHSRMPTFEDRDNLPYIRATARELLRWKAISPLGTEHVSKEDDWYQGYFIPKGTMCLANLWLMNRNREVYGDDVEEFNPDRFIDSEGKLKPSISDTKDGTLCFNPGPSVNSAQHYNISLFCHFRSMCPARHLSNDIIFIFIARLLWAVKLSAVVDKTTGCPIIPDLTATIVDGVKTQVTLIPRVISDELLTSHMQTPASF
ncbi:Cytochrome P450 monooxygenase [Psilocybe cubensis]|uniref:Cytochrome P450 n=2 Tax=Psilocybe cubensis TaxID=181762 RepID=A0A8H7XWJ8_PSICU|nr:Cytochrome P450 monooxygenase [Psilocybe cubensis]KAH9478539.1 Cytochrome P450 monooxygenase [Psilocybe cubensis]